MTNVENKKEFLDALANGLRLMETFDEQTRSVTIQSASEKLGVTRSAARRIVLTLTELGYLEQEDRNFSLTPRAIDLGYRYFRSLGVAGSLKPHLYKLSRKLGVAAAVGVLDGPDVLFIERVEADRPIKLDLRPGDRLPAYAHSLGRVLLAQLPEGQVGKHLPQGSIYRISTRTLTERENFMLELRSIRQQGWSFVNSDLVRGLFGVAIALSHPSGASIAGLNVTSIGEPWSMEEIEQQILPAMRECAEVMRPITDAIG